MNMAAAPKPINIIPAQKSLFFSNRETIQNTRYGSACADPTVQAGISAMATRLVSRFLVFIINANF
jgi:hypothetical protein